MFKRIFMCSVVLLLSTFVVVSCEKPIEGELSYLLEDTLQIAHAPRWSYDGSKVYFIFGDAGTIGEVGVFDLNTSIQTQITELPFGSIDLSQVADLALTLDGFSFRVRDSQTWNVIAEYQPCSKAVEVVDHQPQFSYKSEQLIYYSYWIVPDSTFLNVINRSDSSDTNILMVIFNRGDIRVFAPGPGDTLVALNDTVYNLTSGERIPTKVKPEALNWNPANPDELLIATGKDSDLFLFNIETRKLERINVELPRWYVTTDARFSPDGKRIVLVGTYYGDGYQGDYLWLLELRRNT